MKNQRLVEAINDLIIKRVKAHRSIYWSMESAWSTYESSYWSVRSAYGSVSYSAYYSAQLDKPKVLEIIKARLK